MNSQDESFLKHKPHISLVFKTLQWVFIILMQDKHKTPSSGSFLCLGYISTGQLATTLILFILTKPGVS